MWYLSFYFDCHFSKIQIIDCRWDTWPPTIKINSEKKTEKERRFGCKYCHQFETNKALVPCNEYIYRHYTYTINCLNILLHCTWSLFVEEWIWLRLSLNWWYALRVIWLLFFSASPIFTIGTLEAGKNVFILATIKCEPKFIKRS